MLVHICCSVDSFYFIKRLQEELPNEKIIGFFYDPNIHPYSEYYLRMLDAKRSCDRLGVDFLEGEYDYKSWCDSVRGLESEPENSIRCKVCFDGRLEESGRVAKELGIGKITTTLLMSPKKDFEKLKKSAESVEKKHGVEFVFYDFRKAGGTQAQFKMAKEENAYKQNYCGCLYGLRDQRTNQMRSANELYRDIHQKILPNSIEDRLALYEKRDACEHSKTPYKISKRNILNYRLLWGKVSLGKEVLRSHFLPFSYSKTKKFNVDVSLGEKAFFFSTKDLGISFEDLTKMSFEEEMNLRVKLGFSYFDLSVVIILEEVKNTKYRVEILSETFDDTREIID